MSTRDEKVIVTFSLRRTRDTETAETFRLEVAIINLELIFRMLWPPPSPFSVEAANIVIEPGPWVNASVEIMNRALYSLLHRKEVKLVYREDGSVDCWFDGVRYATLHGDEAVYGRTGVVAICRAFTDTHSGVVRQTTCGAGFWSINF